MSFKKIHLYYFKKYIVKIANKQTLPENANIFKCIRFYYTSDGQISLHILTHSNKLFQNKD